MHPKRFLCNVPREPMPSPKRKIGDTGEEVTVLYLESKGFRILERNYLRKWGEIDIVAEKGDLLRFVEVKSVTRESSLPMQNMHYRKAQRLRRAVQTYLLDRKVPEGKRWQVDVACIYLDFSTRRATVKLLENIIL